MVLIPVDHFGERLKAIISVDDTGAFLNATEQLQAKPFADSWKAPPPPGRLRTSSVIVPIVRAPNRTDASKCSVKEVKQDCARHVLEKGKLIGTG